MYCDGRCTVCRTNERSVPHVRHHLGDCSSFLPSACFSNSMTSQVTNGTVLLQDKPINDQPNHGQTEQRSSHMQNLIDLFPSAITGIWSLHMVAVIHWPWWWKKTWQQRDSAERFLCPSSLSLPLFFIGHIITIIFVSIAIINFLMHHWESREETSQTNPKWSFQSPVPLSCLLTLKRSPRLFWETELLLASPQESIRQL